MNQFRNALAFAVVAAGHVHRDGIAVAAQELIERQTGGLGHDVVERGVDGSHGADDAVLGPTARGGLAAVSRCEHFFPDAADHEGILADDEIGEALAEKFGAARAFAFARDSGVGVQSDDEPRGPGLIAAYGRVGHPEALFEGLFEGEHFDAGDFGGPRRSAGTIALRRIGQQSGRAGDESCGESLAAVHPSILHPCCRRDPVPKKL